MPYIKQNEDGSLGVQGADLDDGGFIAINIEYNASSVDKQSFVAPRKYIVKNIIGKVTVAGTDAGAVTAAVKKSIDTQAVGAGTALHSGTMNLKGAAHTNQTLTLSTTASDLEIPAGTAIGADFTGVLTSATGVITVILAPA